MSYEKVGGFLNAVNKHKAIIGFVFTALMITLSILGALGMIQFILEETLQAQGFGYAIPAMNKEWELAYAVLKDEEPYIRANIRMLKNTPNPITGRAFREYADATARKIERDKSFFQYMIDKQKREAYASRVKR